MKTSEPKKPSAAKRAPAKVPRAAAKATRPPAKDRYVLRLFVAGASDRSHQAVLRVRELSEILLKGRVTLEVIDIYQQPGLAREHQIVATPTLILALPLPVRRFIGNLANITDLFSVLDLGEKGRVLL